MRNLFALVMFVWVSLVCAANPLRPVDENPELEKISTSQKKTADVKPDLMLLKPNRLTILYSAGQSGFKQSGIGQTYDTEQAAGQGVYLSYERELVSGRLFTLRGWAHEATFAEPVNIGGRDVSIKRSSIAGAYGWQSKGPSQTVTAELGAGVLNQDPESFTVGQSLVPSYFAIGPSLGAGWKWQWTESWGLLSQATVTVPIYFQENGDNSGSHRISGHYFASMLIEAKFNRHLSLALGVIAEGEQHRFDGSGDRGVDDARVSSSTLAYSVGGRYAF